MTRHDRTRLEWAVRALAQPAPIQFELYPTFVCVADELALEYDEWYSKFVEAGQRETFSPLARELITALDAKLAEMSGAHNASLWTDEALCSNSEWSTVRELAGNLIREMEWESAPPPVDRDKYVGRDIDEN